jgi:hypothetical protein
MKHLSYQAFKQLVMDSTDPKKGTKVALQIRDCHERKLPHLRPLESLKGLRMFIMYRKSRHSNGVIELDSLDEFSRAQDFAAYHSWPFSAVQNSILINLGHADLTVLVDYRGNKAQFIEFIRTMRLDRREGYSARFLRELASAPAEEVRA